MTRGLRTGGEEEMLETAAMKLGSINGSSLSTTREVLKVRTDWRGSRRSIVVFVGEEAGCALVGVG